MSKKIKKFSPMKFSGNKFTPKRVGFELYDDKWKKYSLLFLKHNPRCFCCGKKSEVTDHLKPHKGEVELFWKIDNYIPLCHKCHNTATARFDRHKEVKFDDKLKWLGACRAINELTFKVVLVPFS